MSKIEEYIKQRVGYFAELECTNECNGCLKQCGGYDHYLNLITQEVKGRFNTQCTYTSCGGFEKSEYVLYFYAIAFIDEQQELRVISFSEENY